MSDDRYTWRSGFRQARKVRTRREAQAALLILVGFAAIVLMHFVLGPVAPR